MPAYLLQVAYTSEAWAAMVKNPQDRIAMVAPAVEGLGGRVIAGYFAFGEYDVVALLEMPDNVSAAAFAIAAAAGGAVKAVKTTPLMSSAEAMEASRKAAGSAYRPPQ
ncbi:MAG TPA: GYD domain-containing protein [Dehalococcoidia bacterium]|nr:GYD domain-containing protein [Dehalococcoidia bacterium]